MWTNICIDIQVYIAVSMKTYINKQTNILFTMKNHSTYRASVSLRSHWGLWSQKTKYDKCADLLWRTSSAKHYNNITLDAAFQRGWGVAGSGSASGCDWIAAARVSSWTMKARMSSAELRVHASGRWVGTDLRSATQTGATTSSPEDRSVKTQANQSGFPKQPDDFHLCSQFSWRKHLSTWEDRKNTGWPAWDSVLTALPQEDGRNNEEPPTHLERTAHFGFWQQPWTKLTTQRCPLLVQHCAASLPSSGGTEASI